MLNPYILLAVVIAFVANGFYWDHHGHAAAEVEWSAKIEKERADAAEAARTEEHAQQEKVNAALKQQNASLASINGRLRADLDGLRNRPERPADMPDTGRSACAGGTGAELSRPDAEFLAGEAARADDLRAGLAACYQVIDAMKGSTP